MHFDLISKSLTMSGLKIPLSFISVHSTHIQSPSPFPAMGTKLRLEIVIILPAAARGSGGALKLPQRVRAEPGRQMFLMHLRPENEVWERLNSLNRLLAELGDKHAF